MIKSMTGYGRADFKTPHGLVRVEVKTTNHRYFDFSSRVPTALMSYEEPIRKLAQHHIRRGKANLFVTAPETLFRHGQVYVDVPLAKSYLKGLKELERSLGMQDKINLQHIIRMPDVVTVSHAYADQEKIWKQLKPAIVRALDALDKSRILEGKALRKDLLERSSEILKRITVIKKRLPKVIDEYRKKIAGRAGSVEPERMQQDIASFTKAVDITEELVRLATHVQSFNATLSSTDEAGRKIDFLCQEMIRETNTTGAKCNDSVIAAEVIEIKSQLEKIREQAQNLE